MTENKDDQIEEFREEIKRLQERLREASPQELQEKLEEFHTRFRTLLNEKIEDSYLLDENIDLALTHLMSEDREKFMQMRKELDLETRELSDLFSLMNSDAEVSEEEECANPKCINKINFEADCFIERCSECGWVNTVGDTGLTKTPIIVKRQGLIFAYPPIFKEDLAILELSAPKTAEAIRKFFKDPERFGEKDYKNIRGLMRLENLHEKIRSLKAKERLSYFFKSHPPRKTY